MSKINPLNKDLQGVSDKVIVDKINEIIELLNNSFITLDPNTSTEILDSVATVSSIQCDRLTHLPNEATVDIQAHYDNCVSELKGLYDDIMCPKCHKKYFTVGESSCTAVYYPPIIKDSVNINPNHNTCTTRYTCCECGHTWEE